MITATFKGSPANPNDQSTENKTLQDVLFTLEGAYCYDGSDADVKVNDIDRVYIEITTFPNPMYNNFPHSVELTGPEDEMTTIVNWINDNYLFG